MHGDVEISKTHRRDGIRDTQHNGGSESSQSLDSCKIFVEAGPYARKHREWLQGLTAIVLAVEEITVGN